jgi:Prokaryotic Cytochrome C oxidase subunit IV
MRWPGSPAGAIWCVLCALTGVSIMLVEGGWLHGAASILIMLIAALKSRLIILRYMEANRAAKHWRFLYETWNLTVTATIIIAYVVSSGAARPWFR